jgi:hypothetical protein
MIVQLYDEDGRSRVFGTDQMQICEIEAEYPRRNDCQHVEAKLRQLRLRRRSPWEPTEWGWQAPLRFIK